MLPIKNDVDVSTLSHLSKDRIYCWPPMGPGRNDLTEATDRNQRQKPSPGTVSKVSVGSVASVQTEEIAPLAFPGLKDTGVN